ncbi:MAG: four helix bundle protein [Bacteroidetes bacterium GWF2_43_63]|nr:MAG: four helix bundle protein [Bacteroidetes bacterium GWE2_42_42]OFY53641.1 MAG: four helix bundle protein [Bacteroidetes bacterium GWF2_43_63]HBG71018.1 four helix bundle protein [Bacteroidales bacterium]HCB63596.1 four helix bundle protein [Bacteroidales bacterium]HCY24345.1 four helix bundle protein [Bacteroidales bacterium]
MNDLEKRLFEFAVRTIKLVRTLPQTIEYKVMCGQLVKSATSSGANYEEAQAGSSKADFNNKTRISLREMRESNYWLRLIIAVSETDLKTNEIKQLIQESLELKLILGSIVQKTRK